MSVCESGPAVIVLLSGLNLSLDLGEPSYTSESVEAIFVPVAHRITIWKIPSLKIKRTLQGLSCH